MDTLQVLKDIGQRNNGDVYLGVVGPVRVGKSSFIKRFMEVVVLENIQNEEDKKRALDELPLSGQGRTITTIEPKFIPANAISIPVEDSLSVNVRLIDCVGYIIDSSNGYLEDGKMRMVKTPWFSEAIPFDEAAKVGTQKVIKDHSTLGIVLLSDGTVNDFSRVDFYSSERKVIEEVQKQEKPFVIVLNSKTPHSEQTLKIKEELEATYQVPVINVDVVNMNREDATGILKEALYQYPISGIDISLPKWVDSLDDSHYIKVSINESMEKAMDSAKIVKDVDKINQVLTENEYISEVKITNVDTGSGIVSVQVSVHEDLYEVVLEELVGCKISDKSELIHLLSQFVKAKKDYDLIGNALEMANATGYGFASSPIEEIKIDKPELTKNGNRYGLKVKAATSCYHIIKVDINTAFEPILGGKEQAEYFLEYLTKAYEKDQLAILDCELFGRKFKDILQETISSKLNNLPEPIKQKLQQIIKIISNRGKGNLIAFVF